MNGKPERPERTTLVLTSEINAWLDEPVLKYAANYRDVHVPQRTPEGSTPNASPSSSGRGREGINLPGPVGFPREWGCSRQTGTWGA